jgi:hypothetical protein
MEIEIGIESRAKNAKTVKVRREFDRINKMSQNEIG